MSRAELEAVQGLETARITAMIEQDAVTLDRLLSDDLHYSHSTGTVETKAQFLANVRNGPLQYRSFERAEQTARLAGDHTALFTGRAAIGIEFDGHLLDLDVRYLAVWSRHGDTWRFEASHSTPVPG